MDTRAGSPSSTDPSRHIEPGEVTFRALVERLPAIVFVEEYGTGRTLYVNPRMQEWLGFTEEEWTDPDLWKRYVHPDDLERTLAEIARTDETGEPFEFDYRLFTPHGRMVWIHEETELVRHPDGTPAFWQGVMIDATTAKEADERVRQAESMYRRVVEHSPAALYTEDLDPSSFGTTFASPQIEAITGYPPRQWVDDQDLWLHAVHPDELEQVLAAEERCTATGEPFDEEYRVRRPDGSVVWIHDRAILIRDEDGTPEFWLGFFHDVTEKKEAEVELARAFELEHEAAERLRSLDEVKDTFVAAVSHDLRSPLTAILGSARTLQELGDGLSREDHDALVGGIIAKSHRLASLVEGLLDLDRLRRGAATAQRTPQDLAVIATGVLGTTGLAERRPVNLRLRPVTVPLDRAMAERIIENLLANAERHTPPDAQVWVSVGPFPEGAELVVEDDGPGVDRVLREALFEPFRQGPEAGRSGGVGVGLALVRRFAELHGGRAWVCERSGGGASFHVTFAAV
jgi:two-component system, sensor histidine kinase and response regulator